MSENKLQDVMQESQPIGDVPIGERQQTAPVAPTSSQPTEAPKRRKAEGPPDGLSSINPAFYNGVVNTFHSISDMFDKIKHTVKPEAAPAEIAEKRQAVMQQAVIEAPQKKRISKFNSKFVGLGVVIVLVVAIAFVGMKAVQTLRGNGGFLGLGNGDGEPTPTLSEVEPDVPSIYARDEVILVLEEDINTLDGQLSSTVLKESSLDVPQLDMEIRF